MEEDLRRRRTDGVKSFPWSRVVVRDFEVRGRVVTDETSVDENVREI